MKKIILLITISFIISITFALSYSYFIAKINNSETTSSISLNSGSLTININGGNTITANLIKPSIEPFITKTITVTGTNKSANKYMQYKLILIIDNNTFSSGAISYTIEGTNTTNNGNLIPNTGESILSLNTQYSLGTGGFLRGNNQIHTYQLKLFFLETNTDQSIDMNKTFSAHIEIEGSKVKEVDNIQKGDLITMNVGEGLPNIYRILKTEGTEALVLAMQDYNVGTTYKYNAASLTTSFNGITGPKYEGSDLDTLLNTTMYNEMNSTAKSAIVAKNIDQNMLSYSDEPDTLELNAPYSYDYQYQYEWDNNEWENGSIVGSVNIGERYIYALDVTEIFEYIGKRYISSNELNKIFYNSQSYSGSSNIGDYWIWLRSSCSYSIYSVLSVDSDLGTIVDADYNLDHYGVRASFVIDLSKIEYQKIPEKGDLITIDVGDGLPDIYRVLKLEGTEALVLAMQDYNVGSTYKYNSTSTTESFNGTTGQKYAGSDLDNLLNVTMYGEMNSIAKSAIKQKNITQSLYEFYNTPDDLETEEPFTYDYQFEWSKDNSDWDNAKLIGKVNVGMRYIYALELSDIFEYVEKRYITSEEIEDLFYKQYSSKTIGYEKVWLRTANSNDIDNVWYSRGAGGEIDYTSYSSRLGVRPAFIIDLSKIEYEPIDS